MHQITISSDEDFQYSLQHFSRDAQEAMWRDRRRDIARAKDAIARGQPVSAPGVAELEELSQVAMVRRSMHARQQQQTPAAKPTAAKQPSQDRMNKFAEFVGKRFRDFQQEVTDRVDELVAEVEKRLMNGTARRAFIEEVKQQAGEIARYNTDNRIEAAVSKALADHRDERVRLQREVSALHDEVTALKQRIDGSAEYGR